MSPLIPFPEILPQVQVTLDCNCRCSYCFQKHPKGIIPLSIVRSIFEKIADAKRSGFFPEKRSLTITWHGGEPLMAGPDFFKGVIRLQAEFPGVVFQNRVQTNATLMTEDFARLFKDHGFQVGFSLDGPESLHNLHRRMGGGKTGSFSRALKGMEIFRRVTGQETLAVIAVITRDSMGRTEEIFRFFRGLKARVQLDICDINCKDLTPSNPLPTDLFKLTPSPGEVGEFLIRLFDLWFHDPFGDVDFPELRDEVKMILRPGIDKGSPYHKRRCSLGRLIFAPDGKVYPCDQYINDSRTALGDITRDSLKALLRRRAALWSGIKARIRKSAGNMDCFDCEWGRRHAGGCMTCLKYNTLLVLARHQGLPDNQWFKADLPPFLEKIKGETYYCSGLKVFRAHVKQAVHKEMAHA
ncbi:radical SAM/SPASM domain-containing protein [Desulfospira joergensenii]|uniref:radical SAM/SPASM domain-containing protein n=1 Tax=Desulfospira joergensenii TaxID=53329 RepID=UPI0003B66462|nr:radical SAM protein [Desulfospira joergensenii]